MTKTQHTDASLALIERMADRNRKAAVAAGVTAEQFARFGVADTLAAHIRADSAFALSQCTPVRLYADGGVCCVLPVTPWPVPEDLYVPMAPVALPSGQSDLLDELHAQTYELVLSSALFNAPEGLHLNEPEAIYETLGRIKARVAALVAAPAGLLNRAMFDSWDDAHDAAGRRLPAQARGAGVQDAVRVGMEWLNDTAEDWLTAVCEFRRAVNAGDNAGAAEALTDIRIKAQETEGLLRELVPACVGVHGPRKNIPIYAECLSLAA